jgi:GNAT superfamily N-acetyltransferase
LRLGRRAANVMVVTDTDLVRALGPQDWQTLRDLRLAALRTDPDAFYSTWQRERSREATQWQAWPRSGVAFGAWHRGEPAGLVGVAVHPETPADADLFAMWVAPAARGSGAADALIEAAVGWAAQRGCSSVRLEVAAGNTRAERVYARNGFVPVAEPTLCEGGLAMRRCCA